MIQRHAVHVEHLSVPDHNLLVSLVKVVLFGGDLRAESVEDRAHVVGMSAVPTGDGHVPRRTVNWRERRRGFFSWHEKLFFVSFPVKVVVARPPVYVVADAAFSLCACVLACLSSFLPPKTTLWAYYTRCRKPVQQSVAPRIKTLVVWPRRLHCTHLMCLRILSLPSCFMDVQGCLG